MQPVGQLGGQVCAEMGAHHPRGDGQRDLGAGQPSAGGDHAQKQEGDEELSRMMMLEAQMMREGEDADGFDQLDGEVKKKLMKGQDEEEQD